MREDKWKVSQVEKIGKHCKESRVGPIAPQYPNGFKAIQGLVSRFRHWSIMDLEDGRWKREEISRLLNALPTRLLTLVPANSKGYMLEEDISKTPDPYARSQISPCEIAEEKYYVKRQLMTTDA